MKVILAALLAFLSFLAMADGVALITAGPPVSAKERNELLRYPSAVSVQGIKVNRNAFGANILTVEIDGKVHTFVGQMVQLQLPASRDYEAWRGMEGDFRNGGTLLSLTRVKATGEVLGSVIGQIRRWEIMPAKGGDMLVEKDYSNSAGMQEMPETPLWKLLLDAIGQRYFGEPTTTR